MCLAVPAKLVSRSGDDAMVDLHGNRVQVSAVLVPGAGVGDWVLVHAGFAIQQVNDHDAQETWKVLSDLDRAAERSRP